MKAIIVVAFFAISAISNALPAPGDRSEASHSEPAASVGMLSENAAPIANAPADTGTLYQ